MAFRKLALFLALTYQPVIESLFLGQSNIILLFLVTLTWWGLRTRRSWAAAAALAAACHIKFQFGFLLPFLWWVGYRNTSFKAMGLVALGYAITFLTLGSFHLWQVATFISTYSVNMADWSLNLAPRAVLYRLFDNWDQGKMVAEGLWLATAMVLLVFLIRHTRTSRLRRRSSLDAAWGMGLASVILLSPYTQEHHLVVLLLPLTLLLCEVDQFRLRELLWLTASILLIAERYSFEQFPAFHHGILSIFLTGKVLGVGSLFVFLSFRLRKTADAVDESATPCVVDSSTSHSIHPAAHGQCPTFAEAR